MKKIVFLALMLVGSLTMAQENRTERPTPSVPLKYSNDIVIKPESGVDQENVKLSVAFNGWLYAAYSTKDSVTNAGGITIRTSRDNGLTWTTIDSYSLVNIEYPAFDIVVAGSDTNNLTLYLVGVNHNTVSSNYVIFVDRYNCLTGTFISSNLNMDKGSRTIYDVAIATDYRFPAAGASPYSIAVAYTVYSSANDSLNSIVSIDGGNTFTVFENVMATGFYMRKLSLSYGRSASASNGRYFAAWELLESSMARNGHIYTSRNTYTVDGVWNAPLNLDSVSSTMINLCRNPSLATQYNALDNDSGSVSAIVLVERDYNGDASDYDVLGFYNMRAHYTNYWFRLDIINNGEQDFAPDISYDPFYNNFLTVYYDSTNGKLPYIVNNMNLATPSAWTIVSPQYNDVVGILRKPQVEINPVLNKTAHVWIQKGSSRGIAMFDAEYNYSGIEENQDASLFSDDQLYPNPATDLTTLRFSMNTDADINIQVYSATGTLIESRTASNKKAGEWQESFDVQHWSNGIYMITVRSNNESITKRLVVSH